MNAISAPDAPLNLRLSRGHHCLPISDRGCTTHRVFAPFDVQGLHMICPKMAEIFARFAPGDNQSGMIKVGDEQGPNDPLGRIALRVDILQR